MENGENGTRINENLANTSQVFSTPEIVTNEEEEIPRTSENTTSSAGLQRSSDNASEDELSLDDDITEIGLDDEVEGGNGPYQPRLSREPATMWTAEEDAVFEQRRREVLTRDLRRLQRANFINFLVLCSVPVILLFIVLINVVTDIGECSGSVGIVCKSEPRAFMNAFTSRCLCEAIQV
mmetsp:Transcript_7370/g.10539  ORF Transcript_7370/g.10539 Transcript_7370/m.10539 type:complete len:180 (+) Transcript_7370:33-572(+)